MSSRDHVLESIADQVARTPMVRLTRIGQGLASPPLALCSFLHRWGSVDLHAAIGLLRRAEASGWIKPGDTIIEPSNGDSGVGMAMAATASGYRVIVTMPDGAGLDKRAALQALGVRIIRTPADVAGEATHGYLWTA